jgi:hypothetical protein
MNQLELYNDILFLDLRPWLKSKDPDLKFKQLLAEVKKEYFTYQPNYEVDFIKPLSNFRKYYLAIIEHEATRYLNDLHTEILSSTNSDEIKYLVHFALTRTLSQKLTEISKILEDRTYRQSQFDLSKGNLSSDKSVADESFAMHCLKHQLIRLLMEVQESYQDHLKEDVLSEEEIYFKYFSEQAPQPSFIGIAANYPNIKKVQFKEKKEEKEPFNALRQDIRAEKKGICSYNQLIKNPSRFAQVEEVLFENGFFDKNYQFSDKYGQKKYFAAIYHQLIRKGYFNNRIFPGNIEVKPKQIRKFLDHRYNSDVDKQFRIWDGSPKELIDFIEKDYWLDHILPS